MRYRVVKTILLPALFTLLLLQAGAEARNYIILSMTEDGLRELRLSYRGRLVMETSVSDRGSLAFNRATDGTRLVETVIRHGLIDDCAVTSREKDILSFISEFSRVAPGEMMDSEEHIMNIYLGNENFTGPSLTSQPFTDNNRVHLDNTTVAINGDITKEIPSAAKSPSLLTTSDFKLSAKITSRKNSSFLHMFRYHLRIPRKARECKKFYNEARDRLETLNMLTQELDENGFSPLSSYLHNMETDNQTLRRHHDHHQQHHRHRHHHGRHTHDEYQYNDETSEDIRVQERSETGDDPSVPANHGLTIERRKYGDIETKASAIRTDSENQAIHTSDTSSQAADEETSSLESLSVLSSSPSLPQSKPRIPQQTSDRSEQSDTLLGSTDSHVDNGHEPYVNKTQKYDREEEGYDGIHIASDHVIGSSTSSRDVHSRSKRDLLTGWMIFPGTKWCGDGDISEHKKDLGYHVELDKCCRRHDLCPLVIPRLSWKYGMFNYRLHTLSHCRCDRKFRKCLQKSTSPLAHLVGQIYFNVVGPHCFKFTQETTCVQRLWWGGCRQYASSKVAYPKKQRRFK